MPSGPGRTQSVTYPNEQPAALSWYHDHYVGDTRMNVVAGLAAGYLIRDGFDSGSNPLLPGPIGRYELPIVVQDRQFNADGSLLYPIEDPDSGGPWIGEYFGDVMLVNGKIWPDLVVEPAVYRFRVLNGCNAQDPEPQHQRRADVHHRRRGRAAAERPGARRQARDGARPSAST